MMRSPKIAGITGRLVVVSLWFSEDIFRCSEGHWLEQMWFWTLVSFCRLSPEECPSTHKILTEGHLMKKLPSVCLPILSWSGTSDIILPHRAFTLLNKFVSKMIATVSVEFSSQCVCAAVTWVSECYSKAGPLVLVLKNLYLKTEICQVLSSLALAL